MIVCLMSVGLTFLVVVPLDQIKKLFVDYDKLSILLLLPKLEFHSLIDEPFRVCRSDGSVYSPEKVPWRNIAVIIMRKVLYQLGPSIKGLLVEML